jgi:hypothetical protein
MLQALALHIIGPLVAPSEEAALYSIGFRQR